MALGHSAGGSDLLGNECWLLLSEAAWENTCIVCCCWYFPSNSGVLVLLSFHHSDCLNLWRIPSLRILNEKSWKCIFGTWGAVQPIPGLPPHGAASRTVLLNSTVAKPYSWGLKNLCSVNKPLISGRTFMHQNCDVHTLYESNLRKSLARLRVEGWGHLFFLPLTSPETCPLHCDTCNRRRCDIGYIWWSQWSCCCCCCCFGSVCLLLS